MMPADDLDSIVELSSASGVSLLHDVKQTAGGPAEFGYSFFGRSRYLVEPDGIEPTTSSLQS